MTQQKNHSITRCQAITDIFESIAKEQEALADILDKVKHGPTYGKDSANYTDYDTRSDKKKQDNKQVELLNAVARIEFILAYKASLFANCACPNGGCPDHDKHDNK